MILLGLLFFIAMKSSVSLPFNADDTQQNMDYTTEISVYDYNQVTDDQNAIETEQILRRSVRSVISDRQQFRQEMLTAHNQYRARHCAPRLTLDNKLNKAAQNYSDYLIRTNKFEHSSVDDGENLAAYSNTGGITGYTGENLFVEHLNRN